MATWVGLPTAPSQELHHLPLNSHELFLASIQGIWKYNWNKKEYILWIQFPDDIDIDKYGDFRKYRVGNVKYLY